MPSARGHSPTGLPPRPFVVYSKPQSDRNICAAALLLAPFGASSVTEWYILNLNKQLIGGSARWGN